jgi:hypothetical protein
MTRIKESFPEKTPIKAVSIYLIVIVVLFYLKWLSEILPALIVGKIPENILDSGTPSNAVYVLDMAWILPAFAIAAVSLWRKQPLGYTLAGTLLSSLALLILAIVGMVVVQVREGYAAMGAVMIFGVLLAITLGILILYFRGLKSPASS